MKPKVKKIILITPLLDHGGGQRYIVNLANYWESLNYSVTIVLLRSGESFFTLSENILVVELKYCNRNTINRIFTGLKAGIKLRKIVKQINPNFILSILSSTNIFTLITTVFLNVKVFVRDAMSPYRKRGGIERLLRKVTYKRANGIIVMTEKAQKFVSKEIGVSTISVIPNPVQECQSKHKTEKEKIVINVGRLTTVKAQQYFLEACAKINRPDWKFVILGDGECRNRLEKKIKELGIEQNATLVGAVKNVDTWLNKSMIFVSTSFSEAWANAICEAMAAGLPVVSFNCDVSPDEIIDHGENGYLVPLGDSIELIDRIEYLMDNESIRNDIGNKAVNKMKQYNIQDLSNKIINFCSN